MKRSSVVFAAVVLVACGGRVTETGGGVGGSDAGGVTSGSFDVAAACASDDLTGSFEPRTGAAFGRAIVGRWIVCDPNPQSGSVLNAYDGMELTSDGLWFALESDGAGGLRRATKTSAKTYATRGTYAFYSPARGGLVSSADSVPSGSTMHLHLNEIILDAYEVSLARSPRRATLDDSGKIRWVTADPEPAPNDEGNACDGETPCGGGLACPNLWSEPGGATEGVCSAPATVGVGEGCDQDGVRTCAAGLTCLADCLRCGTVGGAGAPCDADRTSYVVDCGTEKAAFCAAADESGAPLHCDRSAGVCATQGAVGAWCAEDEQCDPTLTCDYAAGRCIAR